MKRIVWLVPLVIALGACSPLSAQVKSSMVTPENTGTATPPAGQIEKLQAEVEALRRQVALDHGLLFKIRQHVALTPKQIDDYSESAWKYGN